MDDKDRIIADLTVELCAREVQLIKTQMVYLPHALREADERHRMAVAAQGVADEQPPPDDLPKLGE